MKRHSRSKSTRSGGSQRTGERGAKGAGGTSDVSVESEAVSLPASEIRELKRRIREMDDPIRYALASEFSRRFILFYNATDDVYVMNEPEKGTLFKRREVAENVKKLLGKHTVIIKYTTKGGKLRRLSRFVGMPFKRKSTRGGSEKNS